MAPKRNVEIESGSTRHRRAAIANRVKPAYVRNTSVNEPIEADTDFRFPPVGGAPRISFVWGGGPILSAPSIKPIFWGAEWGNPSPPLSSNAILNAINNIIGGPYLSSLGQYGIANKPTMQGAMYVLDSEPPRNPTLAQITSGVATLLDRLIDDDQLPEPDENWSQLNVVFLPSTIPNFPVGDGTTAAGAHTTFQWQDYDLFDVDDDPVRFAFIGTQAFAGISAMDMTTSTFSHELVEAMTDPDARAGWRQNPDPAGTGGEIGDVCGQIGRLDGTAVQAYWSNAANACVIPTRDHSVRVLKTDQKEVTPSTNGPDLHVDVDRDCGKSHRWTGSYTYHVQYHALAITLAATMNGYVNPSGFWTVAGLRIAAGASTITPTVSAAYPSLSFPVASSRVVTLQVSATPGTLVIHNEPPDGNFGLSVTYTVDETSDDLASKIMAASSSIFVDVEGQTLKMPDDWRKAFAECLRGQTAAIEVNMRNLKDRMVELVALIRTHKGPPIDQELIREVRGGVLALAKQLGAMRARPESFRKGPGI